MFPSNPTPLYFKVASDLESKIASRHYAPGDVLPTEEQLCASYRVSRITVRRAMEELGAKRLILRRRGVGTFVAEPSYANRIVARVSSIHDALSYESNLVFTELSRKRSVADAEIAAGLQLEPGAPVEHIIRKGMVAMELISVTEIFLPIVVASKISRKESASGDLIAKAVETKLNRRIARAEQKVAPAAVSGEMATLLAVKQRTPILLITRVYFDEENQPVEMAIVRYHPKRYQLNIELVQSAKV